MEGAYSAQIITASGDQCEQEVSKIQESPTMFSFFGPSGKLWLSLEASDDNARD